MKRTADIGSHMGTLDLETSTSTCGSMSVAGMDGRLKREHKLMAGANARNGTTRVLLSVMVPSAITDHLFSVPVMQGE